MALARVVRFENTDPENVAKIRKSIDEGDLPEGLPATEIIMLHDPTDNSTLSITIVESEDDYRRVDEILGGVSADDAAGTRTAVTKYDVAIRASTS
jgi:hypothetical protein